MNAQRYGRLGLSLAAVLLGGALAPAAFGQALPDEAIPAGPPLYRVEVIVFAYNQGSPSEEDFAHIAAREAAEGSAGPGDIAEFDFGPYVPEEESLTDDPSAGPSSGSGSTSESTSDETSPRSRLLLGGDDETEDDETESDASEPGAEGPFAAPAGTGPFGAALDVGEGEDEAVAADPFGNHPGNAVAPFRFRLLAQDELELTNLRRRLERVESVYTPLVHGGWIQEGLPPEGAKPFDLAYLGTSTPSGTIRLHLNRLSRSLHLTLDLDYRTLSSSGAASLDVPNDDDRREGAFGIDGPPPVFGAARPALSALEISRRFHLDAERRIRSGEIHYFDHPFFGVIAVVRPYEPPEPPPTEGVRPAA